MKRRSDRWLEALCHSCAARPWLWIAATLALSVPALFQVPHLALDSDLVRLLPRHSRASVQTRELRGAAGSSSYFALLFESDDPDALRAAVRDAAARAEALEGVGSVQYRNPIEFIQRYRYLLIPTRYLQLIHDEILDWEAEVNPLLEDLIPEPEEPDYGRTEDRKQFEDLLERYGSLPEYHSSEDGRVMGIFVRPRRGVTSLGATRSLFHQLQTVVHVVGQEHGVWAGVSGSMRNKIDEYDVIVGDLRRSGAIASSLIVLTLVVSFRSLIVGLLPLWPLLMGLLWGFALVPWTVGDLNTITAFLLLVVFGMGIDYSIHLLERFRVELAQHPAGEALRNTYTGAGRAVAASGLTTALALAVLAGSDFRGFSEFGVVGGMAVMTVLAAMFLAFPAVLVLAERAGWIVAAAPRRSRTPLPTRWVAVLLLVLSTAGAWAAFDGLRFDYDFSKLGVTNTVPESLQVKAKQRLVYRTTRSPAAIYVAADLQRLDQALKVLRQRRRRTSTTLGRIASIRDLAPTPEEAARRLEWIHQIREELQGPWTRRVDDPRRRRWIDDLLAWQAPPEPPPLEEVPESMRAGLFAADGSGRPLLLVYPRVERKIGQNAMAFTHELYSLAMPDGVRGPIGETPVFAEILWVVLGEGPWLVAATFLGIFLLVLAYQRSLAQTFWILTPLVTGLALTLGTMALLGIRLNFFNVVVLPALLGLGVDDGIHYYRRWREMGGRTRSTHSEMFVPLTVTSATTIMGYSGMVFADHQGLYSIGLVACLGLALVWLTSLFLLPSLLSWLHPRPVAHGPAGGDDRPVLGKESR